MTSHFIHNMKYFKFDVILPLICVIILHILPQNAFSLYFKSIGTKDGLSHLSVMSIHQDKLGRIWFGTIEGISVYDGERVSRIKSGDDTRIYPILHNRIFTIVENAEGDIFIRADDAVAKYDFENNEFEYIQNSSVTALASINGSIYVAIGDSIYLWNEEIEEFVLFLDTNLDGSINDIYVDNKGDLWVGTRRGLYVKRGSGGFEYIIQSKNIYTIFESSANEMWIGTRMEGMYRIGVDGTITEYLYDKSNENTISSNQVRDFVEDGNGNLWIATFTGLNKYDIKNDKFQLFTNNNQPGDLIHSSIFSLLKDRQGTIWIGTYYGGVSYFNPESDLFSFYFDSPNDYDKLGYPFIGDMIEDRKGDIWLATEGGGLHKLDKVSKKFKRFISDQSDYNSIASSNLQCIAYDSLRNVIYMGSYVGGLISYNIDRGRFISYLDEVVNNSPIRPKTITQAYVYNDTLIFLSELGLIEMNLVTFEMSLFRGNGMPYRGMLDFVIDDRDNLWITTAEGIVRISLTDSDDITEYRNIEIGLDRSVLYSAFNSSDGRVYFVTSGLGMLEYSYETDSFYHYTENNSKLLSNYCYSVGQLNQGYIIVTGDMGVSIIDPTAKEVKYTIDRSSLEVSSFTNGNGILVCTDGEVFIGAADGLISFDENALSMKVMDHTLFFSDLFINNVQVQPNDGSRVLDKVIALTDNLNLKHNQNNLVFTFAKSNYTSSFDSPFFEYMLEGFDKKWIHANSNRIVYTNLTPGRYKLKVREQNSLTNGVYAEIYQNIIINSPFYKSFWAWILYAVFGLTLSYFIISSRQRHLKLKTALEVERREREYNRELNKAKQSFFTNVSHEFRTPLTLIITQVEMLLRNNEISQSIRTQISKVYDNTFYMRSLINELLDIEKSEHDKMMLKIRDGDLIVFLRRIYQSFEEKAQSKRIRYNFTTSVGVSVCSFDPEQLQKVFYNLLSNAFKFTEDNGLVEVNIEETDSDEIVIKIIDDGIGIDKKDLPRIFDRFYQVDTDIVNNAKDTFSTGIGLSLSEEIVKLHKGTIVAESKLNYGTIFIVTLPKNITTLKDEEEFDEGVVELVHDISIEDAGNDILVTNTSSDRHTILIVEDNDELLTLLVSIFSPMYNVVISSTGREGLQKATDILPDIILSDIMMPEMGGDEMCLALKNNIRTCHIPIVLLTAKSTPEDSIDGLRKGADDYITKPFNSKVLLARCNNLIRNRLLIHNTFKKEVDSNVQLLANNELDQQFLIQIEKIIESNIDNSKFDVEVLANDLAMGRSTLFAKFKTLTGMTPSSFILNYKLKRAASLLVTKDELQIKEIADMLGFSSSRYFSISFKREFGVSPMEYKKSINDSMEN